MDICIRVPEDVANELENGGGFLRLTQERSTATAIVDVTFTAMNVGAVVVTLAQGPEVLGRVLSALRRQRPAEAPVSSITIEGRNGVVEISYDDVAEVDLEKEIQKIL